MNKTTLNKIIKFKGDIKSSYIFFTTEIYDNLGFEIPFNPNGLSDPLGSFSNIIRNYRQHSLISPDKLGNKLVLDGRCILLFILTQRYLTAGGNIGSMKVFVSTLSDKRLQELVLADTLTLNDLPINKSKSSPTGSSTASGGTIDSKIPVYYVVRLTEGIQLHIDGRKYNEGQVEQIRKLLKTALDGMGKLNL